MTTWNNCVKIYADGDFLDLEEDISFDEIINSFTEYSTRIGTEPVSPVWFDKEERKAFGSDAIFQVSPNEFSFFSHFSSLEKDPYWGLGPIFSSYASVFHDKRNVSTKFNATDQGEVFLPEYLNLKEKYYGKNILVVGAGPSCVDMDWEKDIKKYDYVWSCNKFYNFNFEKPVDLAFIGPTVDIKEKAFIDYVSKNKTTVLLEGGVTPHRNEDEVRFLIEKFEEKTGWVHTRYFSKLGAAARLVVLAAALRANSVSFVGLDGSPSEEKHAFEPGKTIKETKTSNMHNLFRRQYVLFWEYLMRYKEGTYFNNLGQGHPSNLSTDIYAQLYYGDSLKP